MTIKALDLSPEGFAALRALRKCTVADLLEIMSALSEIIDRESRRREQLVADNGGENYPFIVGERFPCKVIDGGKK